MASEVSQQQMAAAKEQKELAEQQFEARKIQLREQRAIANKQLEAAKQQARESRIQAVMADKAQEMGKSVLVFTVVTTVFLPLSFFTSVLTAFRTVELSHLIHASSISE